MRYDLRDISRGLKNVCDAKKITAVKLAEWVDMADVSINKMYTGKRIPSVPKLFAILNVLDLSLDELLAYAQIDSQQVLEIRETGGAGTYTRSIESLLSECNDEEKKSALKMLEAYVTQIKNTRRDAQSNLMQGEKSDYKSRRVSYDTGE